MVNQLNSINLFHTLFQEPADLKPWPGVWTANTVHKCMQLIRKSKDIYHVIGNKKVNFI